MSDLGDINRACACLYGEHCDKSKRCLNGLVGWIEGENGIAYVSLEFYYQTETLSDIQKNTSILLKESEGMI
jgi:hypothetical protein